MCELCLSIVECHLKQKIQNVILDMETKWKLLTLTIRVSKLASPKTRLRQMLEAFWCVAKSNLDCFA